MIYKRCYYIVNYNIHNVSMWSQNPVNTILNSLNKSECSSATAYNDEKEITSNLPECSNEKKLPYW